MVTQEDLPQQFLAVKDDNEDFLWMGEPEFVPFVCTGLPYLALGLLWFALDWQFFNRAISGQPGAPALPFMVFHLFPFWGSILNVIRLILVHKNTFYAITNKRVMMRSGFWGIDFNAIDYDKISDTQVTVNPLEKMFGVGTVHFSAGKVNSKGNPMTQDFIAIFNPYEVFKQAKTIGFDAKTDWNYPNKLRPDENPGYGTKYKPEQ